MDFRPRRGMASRPRSFSRSCFAPRAQSPSTLAAAVGQATWLLAGIALVATAARAQAPAAKPAVTMDLAIERGAPITASKEWYELLTGLGVERLRIHSADGGEQPKIDNVGPAQSPTYQVQGLIKSNNTLLLPNGKFTVRDRAAIKQWIEKLGAGGVRGLSGKKNPFGLEPDALRSVMADLRKPIDFSTTGLSIEDLVKRVGEGRAYPLAIDAEAAKTAAATKIDDQMQGVAIGAGLAAAVRPAGFVLQPRQTARGVEYRIGKPDSGEFWPIGKIPRERNADLAPKLFEMEDIEITDTPAAEALAAIVERIAIPCLLDYNAMAAEGVEPAKAKVTLPAKRLAYGTALQRALFQARLKWELRVDDAHKPFLWITTLRAAQ